MSLPSLENTAATWLKIIRRGSLKHHRKFENFLDYAAPKEREEIANREPSEAADKGDTGGISANTLPEL